MTSDWLTNLVNELFNPKNSFFKQTEYLNSFQPNDSCKNLEYFRFSGQIIEFSLINEDFVNAHLAKSFVKQILHHNVTFSDLEFSNGKLYIDDVLDIEFVVNSINEETNELEEIELIENGKQTKVTNRNKKKYVHLLFVHYLLNLYKDQMCEFCKGFDLLLPHEMVGIFTSSELDLLICRISKIDVVDLKKNIKIDEGYDKESLTIKFFFNAISKWEQNDLAKLLLF